VQLQIKRDITVFEDRIDLCPLVYLSLAAVGDFLRLFTTIPDACIYLTANEKNVTTIF